MKKEEENVASREKSMCKGPEVGRSLSSQKQQSFLVLGPSKKMLFSLLGLHLFVNILGVYHA